MEIIVYIIRCFIMMLVSWLGIRLIGQKSIAEMTSYDLAAIFLLGNVAAEPLVYKVTSKATIGVFAIVGTTMLIGFVSLRKFFYNLDSKPLIMIAGGKIFKKNLKKVRMNIPLLKSEIRSQGYQDISDIKFAIMEPSGKLSIIPRAEARPVQPGELGLTPRPVKFNFPIIIDGRLIKENWSYLEKDQEWLIDQLQAFGLNKIDEVLLAEMDSTGQIQVFAKNAEFKVPEII